MSNLYGAYSPERNAWAAMTKKRHKWHPPGSQCEFEECAYVDSPWHNRAVRLEREDMQALIARTQMNLDNFFIRRCDD